MEKPTAQPTLHQEITTPPEPRNLALQMTDTMRFINENKGVSVCDLAPKMLVLGCIEREELELLHNSFERVAGEVRARGGEFGPHDVVSLMIFAHMYLIYNRLDDFADVDNFAERYFKFHMPSLEK